MMMVKQFKIQMELRLNLSQNRQMKNRKHLFYLPNSKLILWNLIHRYIMVQYMILLSEDVYQ